MSKGIEAQSDMDIRNSALNSITAGDNLTVNAYALVGNVYPVPYWKTFVTADFKAQYLKAWQGVFDMMATVDDKTPLPDLNGQPLSYWVPYGIDRGVILIPGTPTEKAAAAVPFFAANPDAYKLWMLAASAAKNTVLDLNGKIIEVGKGAISLAQGRSDTLATMVRVAEGVASLGLTELVPIMEAKWAELKAAYIDFRGKADQYQALLADKRLTEAQKQQLREQAGPIVDNFARFFGGDNPDGVNWNEKLKQDAEAKGVSGLGALAALPGILAGLKIAGLVAAIAFVAWCIKKLWFVIGPVLDLLKGLNNALGGMLFPALVVGGLGWVLWKRYGGRLKGLTAAR
jgi:hypothetical protein